MGTSWVCYGLLLGEGGGGVLGGLGLGFCGGWVLGVVLEGWGWAGPVGCFGQVIGLVLSPILIYEK